MASELEFRAPIPYIGLFRDPKRSSSEEPTHSPHGTRAEQGRNGRRVTCLLTLLGRAIVDRGVPAWRRGMVNTLLQADIHDVRWYLRDLARDDVDRRRYGPPGELVVVRAELHESEPRRVNCHRRR